MNRLLALVLVVALAVITVGCATQTAQPPAATPTPAAATPTPAAATPAPAAATPTPSTPAPAPSAPAPGPSLTPSPAPVAPAVATLTSTPQPAPQALIPHVFRLVETDGTELVLEEIPRRVVALSANTAGVLASMGVMPVGMATTARAHHILRDVPQLGTPMSPNIERLRALRPDLVIANIVFKPSLAPIFRQHGLTAYFIDNQRYSDVIANLEMFGRAFFNNADHAQALIDHIRGRERVALAAARGRPQPRVLIIFGTPQAFMLSTQYSYVGEMVTMLGGRNVTEGMTVVRHAQTIPLSMENIIAFNPEIILRISHGSPEQVAQMFQREFTQNPVWGRLDAVRNNRVIDLPPVLFMSNPGLPMIDALEALARFMYP
ncbi:MAG: High-affinity heme uptake system protein IsdE [Firmicutes bacterium]|nr:High-affinity heme uptake system protein IsdE [candidate division NPL-UPA2 bacterium]